MSTTADWLRLRTDDQLVALLTSRPDLVVPLPTDLTVLARRLDAPHSVWRVLESCNALEIAILEAALVLREPEQPVAESSLAAALNQDPAVVAAAVDRLDTTGLVRRADDGLWLSPALSGAFGPFPGGVGPAGRIKPATAARRIAGLDPIARRLLEQLSGGRPRGTVSTGSAAVAAELVGLGLLEQPEPGTVLLTREAGTVVRGSLLGPIAAEPPAVTSTDPGAAVVNGTAADRALAVLRTATALVDSLRRRPVPQLRSGGWGVREIRRLAKDLDQSDDQVALLVELLAAAGLIGRQDPGRRGDLVWTAIPVEGDPIQQWAALATTWLNLRREPARAGTRDETGKVRSPLSAELAWHRGPSDRRHVLQSLADLPAGQGMSADDRLRRLTWSAPLRQPDRRSEVADSVVVEATWLGLVAYDSLAETGRALLRGDDVEAALLAALPAPVGTVVVQADLTVLVPGRPEPELARRLSIAADLESAGGALLYRVTADSLRRSFDNGDTAADLHRFFAEHSATGVPQALTYLIDDVARRHGSVRIGPAIAYLRSDDPELVSAAIARAGAAGVVLRLLAPTVAVTTADPARLLAALDGDGLLPVLEDGSGLVLRADAAESELTGDDPIRPVRSEPVEAPAPTPDQILTLIRRLRLVDAPPVGNDPAELLAQLRLAADDRRPVWIAYVESDGRTHTRLIDPFAVSGGAIAAFDRLRNTNRTFALHRVTSVTPADPEVPGRTRVD